ncbi:hypothetical protein OEZ85_009380 [Tetradesmus obliquus]|uniref:DIRP domain-containing protein n=1 Tax=Tetradesmus obliquus TaxID=3088 RepID=A0ABY8U996_TETOB|nr:hypothetical protein OEZ85_009380 [Tetradesmus obliquus]
MGSTTQELQSMRQWQDEELKLFYDEYHRLGADAEQLAAALPGRSLQDCEQLQKQYHTFLGLPHSQSLQAAFVAMVKDVYSNAADGDEDAGGVAAAAAAAAALAGPRSVSLDADGQAAAAAGSDADAKGSAEQQQQLQLLPAFSPAQPKQSRLAHRLAVELNCLSQGHSQHAASPGAAATGGNGAQYDTGDEDDEQQGTTGGSQGTGGGRPQRMRKPKQYLGEPTGTPRGGPRGGSLPGTPGSSTRRKMARTNTAAAVAAAAAAAGGRRRGGVSAFYGGSGGHHPDSSSARKRRHRRLFEELQAQGVAVDEEDLNHEGAEAGFESYGGSGQGYYGYGSGWEGEEEGRAGMDDDVEEGVDALLSLASMAHASSSCQTDSQHYAAGGEEPGDNYHSKQQHGRSRRSRQQQRARSAGALYSVDEEQDEDGDDEQVEQRQQQRQRHGDDAEEGSGDHDAAAEDAADGLASMRGSQGWGTPKRPSGNAVDFGIFRTGTPGGVGRASEFLLASPGVSDKQLPPMPLPSPSGRRGRPLYGAAAASAAAAAAAGGPRSPAGRGRRGRGGRGRGRRGGSRGGGGGSGSRAGAGRDSGGSSGQRGGSFGGGDGGMGSEGGMGGSDADAGSEEEPELMDASELAGPGLSSPHLRTHSASEPPRSVVLLGKRSAGGAAAGDDAGEETPASRRSVRQRMDGGQPFMVPQPLFSGGGAGSAAAGELAELASDMAAAAAAAAQEGQQYGRKGRGRRGEGDGDDAAGEDGRGRGTRSGRGKRKQAHPAPRNQRKPRRPTAAPRGQARVSEMYAPAEARLRHMVGSSALQRWAMYEWHYSAVDRPYFMRSEMQDLLDGLGLGHVTHLTRGEWSVLRCAAGTPRRLSLAFLKQERHKLEAHRERVRAAYEAAGLGMEVPPELPRPLKVAQAVVARHPGTRSLHDGIVLTIKSSKYRVQFNRSELMTEVVRDTDVMPLDPSECLPLTGMLHTPQLLNGRPVPGAAAAAALTSAAAQAALARRRQMAAAAAAAAASHNAAAAAAAAAGHGLAQHLAVGAAGLGGLAVVGGLGGAAAAVGGLRLQDDGKTDQQLLAELSGVLDRKEGLLSKLRSMNSTAEAEGHLDPSTHRPAESFQASYATGGVYMYQIDSQMAVLNSAFNRHGFTFTLAGAQTYRAASQSLYNAGPGSAAEFEIKRQLRMGGATDLNIFTWAPGDGLLGWATFPWDYKIGSPSSALDGVVVRTATLPGGTARDYNLGYTVVHEVGHWLGLYHTFTNGCNWGGDQIDDTPAEASAASGCPLWRDSCPGDGRRDPVQNYMDYSFDSCMNQFTAGQRARMWSAWDAYRQEKR